MKSKLDNFKKNKNYNLGIELLRMILCFWVLINHCCLIRNKKIIKLFFLRPFHVPTFVIISFYFFYKTVLNRDVNKIKQRFERLLIPYFIWPIIIFIINNIRFYFWKIDQKVRLKVLIIQILIGRPFLFVFWYIFNVIFITFIFIIISFIFNKNFLLILVIFGLLSYFLQYSYLNFFFFRKYTSNIYLSIGLVPELFPIAVTGLLIAHMNIINTLKKYRNNTIFLSLFVLIMITKYSYFNEIVGLFYQGVKLNISGVLLFFIFLIFPFKKNSIIELAIKQITSYTGGIYYLHVTLAYYMEKIKIIKNKSFLGCITLYITNYFICFIGTTITKKTKLKYLFF